MLEVGSIIGGRLRVEQIIGAGGMGIVVAATHLELGNRVAVKVLRDEIAQNPTIVERFIREARAVVNLRTEHVCRVLDVGRLDNGAPYIVMEMLAGVDLSRSIAQRPLPIAMAVDYVMQACIAIGEAHAAGIVHRDLKPANLFVTRRPDGGPLVKVLDFGIAKAMEAGGAHLTHTTGMMGSPGYMSPEQLLSARDVDVRTDIWALGVTLYQLMSARMPFPAPTLTEIAIKVATDPPDPLDVDPQLRAVIWRCLEKDRERRYPSVAALSADLSRFASSDGRGKTGAHTAQHAASLMPPTGPIAMNAPTAASMAASVVPQLAAPIATQTVTVPRARWPLVVGALALVGVTVAIVLAVTRTDAPPAAAPPAQAPVVVAQVPDAGAAIAVVPATPGDAGDPWATSSGPSVMKDDETTPSDAQTEVVETEIKPEDLGYILSDERKAQARKGCQAMLKQKDVRFVGPMAPVLAQCHCAVGDVAGAMKVLATLTDRAQRLSARQLCAVQGVTLPVVPKN